MRTHIFVNKAVTLGEFGIYRKALAKNESRIGSSFAECFNVRPRGLGIDEVGSDAAKFRPNR